MRRAVFLDRDGTLNVPPQRARYITDPSELLLMPGAGQAVRLLRDSGYLPVVVTNQRAIALGILDEPTLAMIHARLNDLLSAHGARIAHFYHCPHDIGDDCTCRKPKPGLIMRAAQELDISLLDSWMVGDSQSDIRAGRAASCRTALVHGGTTASADGVADDLLRAAELIRSSARRRLTSG